MAFTTNIMQSLVPISQFNKGQAAKNNQPTAIILSPEEYTGLTDIEEDYFLLLEANRRIEENGDKETISMNNLMHNLGVNEEELTDMEDIEIE